MKRSDACSGNSVYVCVCVFVCIRACFVRSLRVRHTPSMSELVAVMKREESAKEQAVQLERVQLVS